MAARPMATATISFGLVSIPCKLFPTVDNTSAVRFNYLSKDGSRLRQQYIRASDGEIVERQDRVQGYEFAKGQYVTFTADELKALNVVATNAIDIDEFIPLADVERLYIERVYYLGPDKGAGRSYHLLRAALDKGLIDPHDAMAGNVHIEVTGDRDERGAPLDRMNVDYDNGVAARYLLPTPVDAQDQEGQRLLVGPGRHNGLDAAAGQVSALLDERGERWDRFAGRRHSTVTGRNHCPGL